MSTAAALPTTSSARPSRALHLSLWVVQVLLAAMFGLAGFTKSTLPYSELVTQVPWSAVVGEAMTRFIGISELLGAIGLILPALTRIKPKLTALAGAGLATVMVLAMGYHLLRAEFVALPMNLVLGGLAAFVAWGRYKRAPISPRA